MTIQDFALEGKKAVTEFLRNCGIDYMTVKVTETVKTNDMRMFGLDIRDEDSLLGRQIYIDDLYERYTEGEDLEEMIEDVVSRCADSLTTPPPPAPFMDLECTSDDYMERATVRLLSVRNNICYMDDKPYIDVGNGLALVASINSEPSVTSEWRMTVTKDFLGHLGVDKEIFMTDALANTMKLEPPKLVKLEAMAIAQMRAGGEPDNILEKQDPDEDYSSSVYALTNSSLYQGSAVLFYPMVMRRIAEILGCGYTVIPSSVHELIIVPDRIGITHAKMREMLRAGNAELNDMSDVLSYEIYHYEPGDENLRIIRECSAA